MKVDASTFCELIDHEFKNCDVSVFKKGYRVDNKKRNLIKGIKTACKCDAYKSVDYIVNETIGQYDVLCFVEFSDIADQYAKLVEKCELVKTSENEEANEKQWKDFKLEIRQEIISQAHREAVTKLKDTKSLLEIDAPKFIENLPTSKGEPPRGLIVHNGFEHILPDMRREEVARLISQMRNKIFTALPSGTFGGIKVLSVMEYCSVNFKP